MTPQDAARHLIDLGPVVLGLVFGFPIVVWLLTLCHVLHERKERDR